MAHRVRSTNLTLGNAAYLASPFWEVGGFPPGCFPQEDQVFHRAFRSAGFRIWFDPSIVVHHRHRESLPDFLEHQRNIGYANARVASRLDLPGSFLVKRHRLARLALPGVAGLRLARTLWACRRVGKGLAWRRPELVLLCGRGMAWWSRGFLEAAGGAAPVREGQHAEADR
jgi:GT2 family glycosyltransferase